MRTYQHQFFNNEPCQLPVGKVVCVGRNYHEHIQELNNKIPDEPLFFHKPATALVQIKDTINVPIHLGQVDHELELALLVGHEINYQNKAECLSAIVGYGLALDLTLRDLQNKLKQTGQPWEKAKAFDYSCPITQFHQIAGLNSADRFVFELKLNAQNQQHGDTQLMIWDIKALLQAMVIYFTLLPGDIILTGTPAGVSALNLEDRLELILNDSLLAQAQVKQL